jgi:hypothetical protein
MTTYQAANESNILGRPRAIDTIPLGWFVHRDF